MTAVATAVPAAKGSCACGVAPERANDFYWENDKVGFRAGPGLDVSAARGHDGDLFESKELGVVSLFENPKKDAKGNDEGSTMTAIFVEDPSAVELLTDHMGCRVLAFKKRSFVWKDNDGNETDVDLPVSLDVQFANPPGLMLILR